MVPSVVHGTRLLAPMPAATGTASEHCACCSAAARKTLLNIIIITCCCIRRGERRSPDEARMDQEASDTSLDPSLSFAQSTRCYSSSILGST